MSHDLERVTELLAVAEADALADTAEACLELLGEPVVTVRPEVGVVAAQVREPVAHERFHVGDVVVTRAEVELGGRNGWAIRLGSDAAPTLAAAICAAAHQHGGEPARRVAELCTLTERLGAERAARDEREIAATDVRFEDLP